MELDKTFWVQSEEPDLQHQIHLLEAATATRFESGHQVELQLGHYCNNRCVFCVSGQLTEQGLAREIDAAPILAALEASAANGIKRVTFLGGEPTIQRSFLPSLRRAIELGFDDIVIFTNGARGGSLAWLDEVRALGRFTWRFSIQGANEDAHEAVTMRKRSWRRIMSAISYLGAHGEDLTANMCVTTQSYPSLPEFPALLSEHGVRQLHIDMMRPNNAGQRTDAWLLEVLPRHADMAPYLAEMLAGFEALDPDWDVNVGNYPFCQLPEWANKIHHGGEPTLTLTTGHKGELDRLLKKYDYQKVDAVYADGCDACVFRPQCRGVPARYAELHGTDELVPVSLAALQARDVAQRSFAIVILPTLTPLLDRTPPEGLTLTALTADQRARRGTLTLTDAAGRAVDVLFTPVVRPPRDLPPAVIQADRFDVRLSPAPGVALPALKRVVRWLQQELPTLDGVGPVRRASASATPQDRGAARVARLASALTARRRFGAWLVADRAPAAPPGATVVRFLGPGDAHVDLTLAVDAAGRPSVDLRLGEGTSADVARPVVSEIKRVLAAS